MVILGISMAIINSSLAGLAGMLPPKYMGALMLGMSLNGILVLALRVITLLSFDIMHPVQYFNGALTFFAIISTFLTVCAFGIYIVLKQDIIIFSLAQALEENNVRDFSETERNRNLNKLYNANDTIEFNKAVLKCLHS